jgi:hypothetical protein
MEMSHEEARLGRRKQVGTVAPSNRAAGLILLAIFSAMAIAIGLVAASGHGDSYNTAVSAGSPDNLIAIATLGDTWLQVMALFVVMIVLMAVGLGLLTQSLYQAGSRALAPSAFVLFLLSAAVFLGWLTFMGTVTVWAGEETARTSIVPAIYEPLSRWDDGILPVVHARRVRGDRRVRRSDPRDGRRFSLGRLGIAAAGRPRDAGATVGDDRIRCGQLAAGERARVDPGWRPRLGPAVGGGCWRCSPGHQTAGRVSAWQVVSGQSVGMSFRQSSAVSTRACLGSA